MDPTTPYATPSAPAPTATAGTIPPLTAITPTDQSGVVLIGTALALIFSLVSLLIRLYIRLQLRYQFSCDDAASVGAVFVSIIQAGLVLAQAASGFGKTIEEIPESGLVNLQKYGYAADILYLVVLWLTKCSVAFLFIRLSPYRRHIFTSKACLILSTLCLSVSCLVIGLRCNLGQPWMYINQQCSGLLWRWELATVLDVVTEFALLAVALYMAQGLQLPFNKKLVVASAFSLRILVVIPAITHLLFLAKEFASPDPTLDGVFAAICAQIQLSYAIISTTTPCLRPFMSALNTHYGGPTEARTPTGSEISRTAKSENDYSLTTVVSPRRGSKSTLFRTDVDDGRLSMNIGMAFAGRKDERSVFGPAEAIGDKSADNSIRSDESPRMAISKNTEWRVEFQDRAAPEKDGMGV